MSQVKKHEVETANSGHRFCRTQDTFPLGSDVAQGNELLSLHSYGPTGGIYTIYRQYRTTYCHHSGELSNTAG